MNKSWNIIKGLGFKSVKSTCPKVGFRNNSSEIVFDGDYVLTDLIISFVVLQENYPLNDLHEVLVLIRGFYSQKGASRNVFDLNVVANEIVLKLLSSLNVEKATGSDNLPARFLNDAASEIVLPLTHLIRHIKNSSSLLLDYNTAHGVPLFKKVIVSLKKIIDQFLSYLLFQKFLNAKCIIRLMSIRIVIVLVSNCSQVLDYRF